MLPTSCLYFGLILPHRPLKVKKNISQVPDMVMFFVPRGINYVQNYSVFRVLQKNIKAYLTLDVFQSKK